MSPFNQTISAIIDTEEALERVIAHLLAESTVGRGDISVQGDPSQMKNAYGVSYISPEVIQNRAHPPMQEPYLKDDMGWKVGFSFALPFFLCLVIGVFGIANIFATDDVIFYGIIGGIVGVIIGFFNARRVKRTYDRQCIKQENKGGFVLWVSTHSPEQCKKVLNILREFNPMMRDV